METIRKPYFKILYDNKDITNDITPSILSLDYTDNDEKEADDVSITLEDVDGLWRNSWYPEKGSKLTVSIGYDDGVIVECGTFDIDEITFSGPPDVVSIKGIASGISKSMRTKKSKAYENQTLKQVAQYVASQNGLTVVGNIENIKFTRITQNREKDLAFLARIADEYGYLFSVRDKKMIFTSRLDIEKGQPVLSIDRSQLRSYQLTDKTSETYKDAESSYHNPGDGDIKKAKVDTLTNADGVTYTQITPAGQTSTPATGGNTPPLLTAPTTTGVSHTDYLTGYTYSNVKSTDTLKIRTKAETPAQAEKKAAAALHKKNSRQREGTLSMEGSPLLVAGNNFMLTGLGELSGKCYIKKSMHKIDKGNGYTTSVDVKQISAAVQSKKSKQSDGQKGNAPKYEVQNLTNADGVTYKQITPQQ